MIISLVGENSFLLKNELDKLTAEFVAQHGDLALQKIDGSEMDYEHIKDALLSAPFLATNKMVVVSSPESNKQLLENIEHIFNSIPETTDVIFVVPKPDKRSKFYKQLQKQTELRLFDAVDANSLGKWLVDYAKNAGGSLSLADANYLVNRLGVNQAVLSSEVDKLLLNNLTINREMIDEQTEPNPQSTVFELLDASFAGNHKKAMTLYEEQRRLKVEPLAILGMIAWQLHILAVVATAKDKNPGEIAKEAKIHPFVVNKSKQTLRNISFPQLKDLVSRALKLDISLKSQSINADDALRHFLLSI